MNVDNATEIGENWLRFLGYEEPKLEIAIGDADGARLRFTKPQVELKLDQAGHVTCLTELAPT